VLMEQDSKCYATEKSCGTAKCPTLYHCVVECSNQINLFLMHLLKNKHAVDNHHCHHQRVDGSAANSATLTKAGRSRLSTFASECQEQRIGSPAIRVPAFFSTF
jgi:hypothetical protein